MGLKESGLRGSLRSVSTGVGPTPDSVVWQDNDDWTAATQTQNIAIDGDEFTLNDDTEAGYLTTDRKSGGAVPEPSFSHFDDWGDARLTDRVGAYPNYRVSYFNVDGDNVRAQDGFLEFDGNTGTFVGLNWEYDTFETVARWECRRRFTENFDPSTDEAGDDFFFWNEDADNRWYIHNDADSDDEFNLRKIENGSVTSVIQTEPSISDDEWHIIAAERTIDGNGDANWELFLDGTSLGTAVDNFEPATNDARYINDPESPDLRIDYIEVTPL